MAAPLSTSIELRHLRYFVAAVEHGWGEDCDRSAAEDGAGTTLLLREE